MAASLVLRSNGFESVAVPGVPFDLRPPRRRGEIEEVAAGLVLRSIGFKSVAVPGVPFDHDRAVVPAALARVTAGPESGAAVIPGLYVAGWLRRGPTGIIGSNLVSCCIKG